MEPDTATAYMAAAAASCDNAACIQPCAGEEIHAFNIASPTSAQQMLKRPHKEEWLAASRAEMDNMEELEVYELVAAPPDMLVLGSRWAFSYKIDKSGNISRYKAHLAVQGCQQNPDEVIDRWAHCVPAGTSRVRCTPRQERLALRYFSGLLEGPIHGDSIYVEAAAVRRRQWPRLEAPPPLEQPLSCRQCLVAHLCRRAS